MSTQPSSLASRIGNVGTGAIALGGGIAGALPSNTSTTGNYGSTTGTNTSTVSSQQLQQLIQQLIQNQQNTRQTSTTTPVLDPATQAYLSSLIGKFSGVSTPSLSGYVGQQTQGINAQSDTQQKAVDAILAARGLSTSPVAATTDANIQQNRLNQITQLQEGAPLQLNALQLQNLLAQAQFLGAIPKGATTTGTGQTTGTTSTTGQTGTSGINTSSQIGSQNVSGFNNQQQQQGGGVGGGIAGTIATLLSLFV